MAYDVRGLLNLGQGKIIAERIRDEVQDYLANISAEQVKYGNETVADALEDLAYVEISIESFTNNVKTTEIGSIVNNCTFEWVINKTPATLMLNDEEIDIGLTDYEMTDMSLSLSSPGSKKFVLSATDERDVTVEANSNIYFYNGLYYGVSSNAETDDINDDFIQGLSKSLQNTLERTFTVTAGEDQYIYFAAPTRLGTPAFYVGGFEGGFSLVKTLDYTNASGYTESYDVYRTTNTNLGETTVSVQ